MRLLGRRKALGIIIIMSMLLAVACGKHEPAVKKTSEEVYFSPFFFAGNGAMAENYLLYYSDRMYRIFDVKTQTDIPYCFEPNCTHKAPIWDFTGKLLQDGCPAYKFEQTPILHGENTIWFTGTELIRGDREGKNRKTIATLEIPQGLPWGMIYTDKDFFFVYTQADEYTKEKDKNGNEYWLPGERLEKPEVGIYRISLETGEQQYVCRFWEYDANIRGGFYYNNHLYFGLTYSTKPYIAPGLSASDEDTDWNAITEENRKYRVQKWYSYDLTSGETVCLVEKEASFKDGFFGNGFLCVYDSEEKSSEWFDLTGGKLRDREIRISSGTVLAMDNVSIYRLRDEKKHYQVFEMYDVVNDKVLRHVERGGSALGINSIQAVIGNSYYVLVNYPDGESHEAFISEENFWNGAWDKAEIIGGEE